MNNCGNCVYFIKWKNDKRGGGLCDYLDVRTKTDHGRGCSDHKGKRYRRKRIKTFDIEN